MRSANGMVRPCSCQRAKLARGAQNKEHAPNVGALVLLQAYRLGLCGLNLRGTSRNHFSTPPQPSYAISHSAFGG